MSASISTLAKAVRFLTMDAIHRANSGHPGMALGCADLVTALFTQYLKFDATRPTWPDRDRFVLSAGHASMLLYAVSYLSGFAEMTLDELRRFRCLNSRTPGHPAHDPATGIEITTGALGQGLASAVGFALAERMLNARFGDSLIDHRTYVLVGDGCLMEGVAREAISIAGHFHLNKLIAIWDDNRVVNDGFAEVCTSDDIPATFRAAGWRVLTPLDGNDGEAIVAALAEAPRYDRPTLVHVRTTIGFGAPTLAGQPSMHGTPLGEDEIARARAALDWPHPAFEVPPDLLEEWRAAGRRGAAAREAWEARLAAAPAQIREGFRRAASGELPKHWERGLRDHAAKAASEKSAKPVMSSCGEALQVVAQSVPELVALSADVMKLTGIAYAGFETVAAGRFAGRYVPCGVREHGMAAVAVGMAAHGGILPYATTYLVFAEYLMAGLRQAAMMRQRVIFGFSADSIGVGQNGETHQPVEVLPALRAMPNLLTFRPADAVEAAECWQLAIAHDGPSAFALSHQPVPPVRTSADPGNRSARGGYVIGETGGRRRVTLLATGSEVHIALQAQEILRREGISTAVVSMPCWELFERQPAEYREAVLGRGAVRVAVEASVRLGWDRYIGDGGGFVGMTGFGASAPADKLYAHFGITAESIASTVRRLLAARG